MGGDRCRQVVGFAIVVEVAGDAHVEEVSVLPAFGGRGVGTALLEAVAAWLPRQDRRQ